MIYLQKNNSKKNKRKKLSIFILIVIVLFLLGFVWRDFSNKIIYQSLFPLKKGADYIFTPIKDLGAYFGSKKALTERNEELDNENKFLNIEIKNAETLQKENEELRASLSLVDDDSSDVVAEVLMAPPFSPYDNLIIYSTADLEIGDVVFVRNIIIGEIVEKHEKNYVVQLYSSPHRKIPVRLHEDITAEAEGQGGSSFIIQIPKDIEVATDDLIYEVTNNAVIGQIEQIEFLETSSFQIIRFSYPFSLASLKFVVVREPQKSVE